MLHRRIVTYKQLFEMMIREDNLCYNWEETIETIEYAFFKLLYSQEIVRRGGTMVANTYQ